MQDRIWPMLLGQNQWPDHEPGLLACDCGGPAIPGKREEAPGNVSASRDLSTCRVELLIPTGTVSGKISFVRRVSLLIKFKADVLHSNASRRKWSRTSNVNTVLGLVNVAGKRLDRNNCMYLSGAFGHLHHFTERLSIPVDAMTTILSTSECCCLNLNDLVVSSSSPPSSCHSSSSLVPPAWIPSSRKWLSKQSSVWGRISRRNPRLLKSECSKQPSPNFWIQWKGCVECVEIQHIAQWKFLRKQSLHRYVPRAVWQLVQIWSCGGASRRIILNNNDCLTFKYCRSISFCDWLLLRIVQIKGQEKKHTIPDIWVLFGVCGRSEMLGRLSLV